MNLSLLLQWLNLEHLFTIHSQLPIGKQFLTMDFDPCLHQSSFSKGQRTGQYLSVVNAEHGPFSSVFGMEVWYVVLPVVEEIHANDDAIEHGQDGHGQLSSNHDRTEFLCLTLRLCGA
jgi:hypothetical protein